MLAMTTWLALARAVHYAAAIVIFGELAFALFVATPFQGADEPCRRRFYRVVSWSLAASLAAWLVWLGCEAVEMSGAPLAQALQGQTLALVLGRTTFGRLWLIRLALAAILAAAIWFSARSDSGGRRRATVFAMFAIAGAYLASLAWAGHAAAGKERGVQLASDALHLLAAGAWLGALPALVALLAKSRLAAAAHAVPRFSTVGVASVTTLLVTGLVNAWYLVGDIPALIGTVYGRLLLVKLALFAAMLALAGVNRWVLTPRLLHANAAGCAQLRRSAVFETAAGAGIVAIVGVLGITIPAAHQSPVWPFSRGLDLEPAYPTSYATPPVPYTTAAIARGAALYAQDCASCHGALGHGDGAAGAALPVKPADLAEHAAFHRPGDLFWFVAHGVPDSPMPGFAAKLSETETWSLVRFLRALSDGEAMHEVSASASPPRPIVAPDFAFEVSGQGQQSLGRSNAREMTLLVFYTLPQSLPRLRALDAQTHEYAQHTVRVIAIPMRPASEAENVPAGADSGLRAVSGADVPAVYAMFARAAGSDAPAAHAEFLIDARSFLRRRWLGVPGEPENLTAEELEAADAVASAPPLMPMEKAHAH